MKKSIIKLFLFTLFLLISVQASAISYTITFTANGASTIIDQVVVNNLTQGTTVTVPAGSSLLLTDATSVPQLNIDESLRIFPNPIFTKAKVSFYSEKGGSTQMNVFGMDGRKVLGLVENLQVGDNEFVLSLPKGVFVLHINDKENTHKAKVISQNYNHAAIEFSGRTATSDVVAQKVNSSIINMNYNAGDILIFKAHSGNFVSILADVITADKTVNFKMVECIDQEGNYYPVVTIGTQTWLAENLNTSRFRNNVAIADKTNDPTWGTTTSAAYSDYASPSTSRTYGKLYNGYAVTDPNNLAPVGWHIPTDADWTILSDYLGGLSNAGSKLKEKGNSHWMNQNSDATNETGFKALPGGTRSTDGNMYDFGSIGYWWSVTEGSNINSSWYRYLQNSSGNLFRAFYNKNAGMSVRCVMGDLATLSTSEVSSITATTATGGGDVSFDGNLEIIAKGICWSTTTNPTISNDKTVDGTGTGAFNSSITGLTINNTYYVRAYATNSFGTAYGLQVSFSTNTPTLNTTAVTSLTSTSAVSGGNISSIGGSAVTARGVCWSTSPNPTTEDSKTNNGSGSGSFTSSISGLTPETTYYVRAYAINSIGTSYGTQVSFSTKTPVLTTTAITTITATSAVSGGSISSIGGSDVTDRGVCWSTSPNPTTEDSKTSNGSGSGTFTSSISGLTPETTYYVRAYAINSIGTSYGQELSFTTLSGIVSLTTNTPGTILLFSATSGGNITNDGGAPVTARGVCWSTFPNPTTEDSKTSNGSGTGSFTSYLTGLTPDTKYYVRSYATNSIGTSYGQELSLTTLSGIISLTTNTPGAILLFSATSGGNITNNGGAPVTARGVCWSTSPNPTVSLSTKTSNGTGNGSFISSISGLSESTTYYVRAYATNSVGTSYGNEFSFTTPAPITVTSPTGKLWMDRNLGASRVATSSTDSDAYGDLYQWGRGTDGHEKRTSQTTSTLSSSNTPGHGNFITIHSGNYDWRSPQNNNLWQGVSGTNNPCPEGFRLPTIAEWQGELNTWSNKNSAGAFASPLKLPVAGTRDPSNGSLYSVGSDGYLWSSTVGGTYAQYLGFFSSTTGTGSLGRASGRSVRCLKDD
jgi:uncharacterized protein (TIGR02145 family)